MFLEFVIFIKPLLPKRGTGEIEVVGCPGRRNGPVTVREGKLGGLSGVALELLSEFSEILSNLLLYLFFVYTDSSQFFFGNLKQVIERIHSSPIKNVLGLVGNVQHGKGLLQERVLVQEFFQGTPGHKFRPREVLALVTGHFIPIP